MFVAGCVASALALSNIFNIDKTLQNHALSLLSGVLWLATPERVVEGTPSAHILDPRELSAGGGTKGAGGRWGSLYRPQRPSHPLPHPPLPPHPFRFSPH